MTIKLDSKFSEQTNTCEFRKAVNLANGQGGLKLEINIHVPPQHILAKSKGGLMIEGGVILSEYGTCHGWDHPRQGRTMYGWDIRSGGTIFEGGPSTA